MGEARYAEIPLKKVRRDPGERVAAAAEAGGGQGQGGPRDACRRQCFHGVAHPHTLERGVAVAGVADEGNGEASKVGGEPGFGEAEERPDKGHAAALETAAIDASPSSPLPRRKRIRNVSA